MTLLSVEQAAKQLKKTERTIRRWLSEGLLTPYHSSHGRKDKYLVDSSEVERLATELALAQPERRDQGDQDTSSLESKVAELEKRIEKLEDVLLSLGSISTPAQAAAVLPGTRAYHKRATERVGTQEPPIEIPAGSLEYWDFAERHGVSKNTFRDHMLKGLVPSLERVKPHRPAQKEHWLTLGRQRQAIAFWQENGTAYSTCDNPVCACQNFLVLADTISSEQETPKQEISNEEEQDVS